MALILYEIKKISLLAVIWIKFVMLSTVLTALWVIDEPTTPTVLTADFISLSSSKSASSPHQLGSNVCCTLFNTFFFIVVFISGKNAAMNESLRKLHAIIFAVKYIIVGLSLTLKFTRQNFLMCAATN